MSQGYDYLFKILLIGDSGVGKSSLMQRISGEKFAGNYLPTIGVDFKIRTLEMEGKKVCFQIWDTAGQERFRTITSACYRGTHGVLVVYDVNNARSFINVKRWIGDIERNCETVDMILVGNKNDMPDRKVVLEEDARLYADQVGVQLFETSAKENINVDETFTALARKVLETKMKLKERYRNVHNETVRLKKTKKKKPKNICTI